MKQFVPKPIICTQNSLTYRYTCKNIHLNKLGHQITNTYRFNKGVPYLIKNQEDYDEIIALPIFEDYITPEEKAESAKSETTKQRKVREKAEAKANKEAAEKSEKEKMTEAEMIDNPGDATGDEETTTGRPDEMADEDNSTEIKEEGD